MTCVRTLVVDVDLDRARVAGDEDGLADRLEGVADRVDVERLAGRPGARNIVSKPKPSSASGAGARRGCARSPAARHCAAARAAAQPSALPAGCRSAPSNNRYRPCPPESTTPASRRIGEQRRVLATAFWAAVDRRAQDRLDVALSLGARDRRRRGLADDRQDRALDRLGDGAVGRLRARVERIREVERVEPRLARQALGDAHAGSGS